MKVRVRRKDADISSGIGLHVPRYTQLLAESYNEVEFYGQSVFPPTELPMLKPVSNGSNLSGVQLPPFAKA
ncbi:hypothetical protein Tco_0375414, partial [Tanacetum coccineum]